MPINRFFIDETPEVGKRVILPENELKHLLVMRLELGEIVELVDGKGVLAKANLIEVDRKKAVLEIVFIEKAPPLSPQVTLAVPLMRLSKLEWVIEKGTELGAHAFWVFSAEQSEKENISEHQKERLKGIAIAAMKQSGRLYLPEMIVFNSLQKVLEKGGDFYFGDTGKDGESIREFPKRFVFITGPEKGFSEREKGLLSEKGKGVRLNPNTLRAETAPIAGIAICMYYA